MNTLKNKIYWAAGTIIVAILIGFLIFAPKSIENSVKGVFGAITAPYTTLTALQLQQGLRIPGGPGVSTANSGTPVLGLLQGKCNATTVELPLEATSTDNFYCTIPGVQAGDNIMLELPSDSGSVYGGFNITYAIATTSGQFVFGIQNNTGSATSTFPLATTSIAYFITR